MLVFPKDAQSIFPSYSLCFLGDFSYSVGLCFHLYTNNLNSLSPALKSVVYSLLSQIRIVKSVNVDDKMLRCKCQCYLLVM